MGFANVRASLFVLQSLKGETPPPGACLDIFEDPRAAGKVLCVHLVDGGTAGAQSLQILAISLDDGTEQVVVEQYAARPAPHSVQRALLMPQVHPGSLYRGGNRT